jgi:hypothetical protein
MRGVGFERRLWVRKGAKAGGGGGLRLGFIREGRDISW